MIHDKLFKDDAFDQNSGDTVKNLLRNNGEIVDIRLTDDNKCGFLCFHQSCFQRLASKKAYVFVHGFAGTIMISIYAFFNGIVTTLEKRFQIPTRNVGMIVTGFEIAGLSCGPILTHFLKRGHRPKWVSFAILTAAFYCFSLSALHLMYGPGKDALDLTIEYGAVPNPNVTNTEDLNSLCQLNVASKVQCEVATGDLFPQIYLFMIHLGSGIFGFLYESLGTSYIDDNIQKSKAPMLLSISLFVRLLGPSLGFGLASMSVAYYIAPHLTPTITQTDSRWMGAWWIGPIINGILLTITSFLLAFFPKELPRAAIRRQISELSNGATDIENHSKISPAENLNFKESLKQMLKNKVYMLNIFSAVVQFLGLLPFWMYAPKYIEIQYRQTAAEANFLTGSVAILFNAVGTLSAGFIIQKIKPTARQLSGWNVLVGLFITFTTISFVFIGCPGNDNAVLLVNDSGGNFTNALSPNCHCEHVKFLPICGENGNTYVSPCHAGCMEERILDNSTTIYDNCYEIKTDLPHGSGQASSGLCPVNCEQELLYFMIILCIMQFIAATVQSNKLLITMRSVDQRNKAFALSFASTITSLVVFMPGPIIYGWIFDQSCLFWGKTCTGTGNCWLYDKEIMRKYFNLAAASVLFIATILEFSLWRNVKKVQLFDKGEEGINNKMKDMNYTISVDK